MTTYKKYTQPITISKQIAAICQTVKLSKIIHTASFQSRNYRSTRVISKSPGASILSFDFHYNIHGTD